MKALKAFAAAPQNGAAVAVSRAAPPFTALGVPVHTSDSRMFPVRRALCLSAVPLGRRLTALPLLSGRAGDTAGE